MSGQKPRVVLPALELSVRTTSAKKSLPRIQVNETRGGEATRLRDESKKRTMIQESGNGHKRAVLYARVSTDDQADKGYSLPSQLEMCRKYAERLGYPVVAELTEDISGIMPISERPEGKKLTAMLKARQADAVTVYQVDRLSRDIVDLLAMVRVWLRAGVEVHTCDIGKVESELDIVLVIKGWQGGDERKKIVERTSRGRYAKAKAGKVVGNGWSPYGYRYVGGSFEIV